MKPVTVTADDGARLVCWDFGGHGQPVLMLHGTGLHGRCWAPVARLLGEGLRPLALDMRGHGSSDRSPDASYDWRYFATDALAVLDQLGLSTRGQTVVGAGHSSGASSLLLAEASVPGSFSRLWAWEPIMNVPGGDLARRDAELAQRARQRRARFSSIEEARAHFEGRGQFAEFSPGSLQAFLEGAFVPGADGGLRLACDPEDEAQMYNAAMKHDAWEQLVNVRCPVRLVGGGHRPAVPPHNLESMAARLPAGEVTVMPTLGHFGPFADPAAAAADIAGWAARGGQDTRNP